MQGRQRPVKRSQRFDHAVPRQTITKDADDRRSFFLISASFALHALICASHSPFPALLR